jgi:hypothetical protein
MRREDVLMMQLLGGGGGGVAGWLQSGGWMQVVFLAFLLAVPILRPERIRVVAWYRWAYVFFALSIVAPSAASFLIMTVISPGGVSGSGVPGLQTLQLFNAAGPVLFGLSLIFAMKAIVPGFIPPRSAGPTTRHGESPSTARGASFDGDVAE